LDDVLAGAQAFNESGMVKSLLGGKASSEDVFFSNEDDLMNAIGVKTNAKATKVE